MEQNERLVARITKWFSLNVVIILKFIHLVHGSQDGLPNFDFFPREVFC